MSESLGVATLELEGDLSGLEKDLAAARRKTTDEGKKASAGFGARFGSGIKKATLPAIAALGLVAAGAKRTVDAASALGEQVNKTNVVFGDGAAQVQAWAKTTASSLGISNRAALEASGTFGNMLVPMGIGRKMAAGMSMNFVTLAADMASFNDASPEETLDALRAGLAGETEPLRRFGVFLNEARIQAEAMSSGLVKATKDTDKIRAAQIRVETAQRDYTAAVKEHGKESLEARKAEVGMITANSALKKAVKGSIPPLDAKTKALATNNLIMKDTRDAQGDFGNTITSIANAERVQAAETEDLTASIGKGLMPAYQMLQQILLRVTGFMGQHTTAVKVVAGVVALLAASVLIARGAMASYRTGVLVATAAQWLFNAAVAANPVVLIVAAIIALGVALVIAYKKSETFRKVVGAAIDFVRAHWKTLLLALGPFGLILRVLIGNWRTFRDIATGAINKVRGLLDSLKTKLANIRDFLGKVKDAAANAFNSFRDKAQSVVGPVQSIVSALRSAWNWLTSLTSKVWKIKVDLPSLDLPSLDPRDHFDTGGVVRGPRGAARLVVAHGGETILPTHKPGFRGTGGGEMHFHFPRYSGNRRELIADIRKGVQEHRRATGGQDPFS